ncbi:hypothetical protein SKAU_G00368280 [Synaphobranchus kaupii]|uniref:Uncharacterized protein n=1 Tax=Synaphobranchus kaupii TaxID=118154 RepID=A0A9Q1IFJ3_SYNKA|nr:hypothetical protein SKAU_G00368280 [Synaphobranchus kaupii]
MHTASGSAHRKTAVRQDSYSKFLLSPRRVEFGFRSSRLYDLALRASLWSIPIMRDGSFYAQPWPFGGNVRRFSFAAPLTSVTRLFPRSLPCHADCKSRSGEASAAELRRAPAARTARLAGRGAGLDADPLIYDRNQARRCAATEVHIREDTARPPVTRWMGTEVAEMRRGEPSSGRRQGAESCECFVTSSGVLFRVSLSDRGMLQVLRTPRLALCQFGQIAVPTGSPGFSLQRAQGTAAPVCPLQFKGIEGIG